MSSPWDPAISQTMQRHGGSNRSIPKKAQPQPSVSVRADELPAPGMQGQVQNESSAFVKPEKPAA